MSQLEQITLQELADFAAEVRRRRMKLRVTQTEIARRVGCSVKQVNNIERAVNWPSMPVYLGLCRELGFRSPLVR